MAAEETQSPAGEEGPGGREAGKSHLGSGLHDLTKPHPHPQVLGTLSQSG